jgi:hypothetical protein
LRGSNKMSGIFGGSINNPLLIQEFTSPGLLPAFAPPPWATENTYLDIYLIGGGAGGASGRRGLVSGGAASGGGAGSAGLTTQVTHQLGRLLTATGLTLSQLLIEPNNGIGGTGGARPIADNSNGSTGLSGGTTTLRLRNASNLINRTIAQASGGAVGAVGSLVSANGGIAPQFFGFYSGSGGGAGGLGTGGAGSFSSLGATGGGGGAGHPTGAWITTGGGNSQQPAQAFWGALITNAAGGSLVSGQENGQSGTLILPIGCPGVGGGGGASTSTGIGGNGGDGSRGGGGGGGGATGNATASPTGKGGKGGDGYTLIVWRGR